MADSASHTAFITGFPRLLARGLALRALAAHPNNRAWLLVAPGDLEAAGRFHGALPPDDRARLRLFEGSLSSADLGLSGPEVCDLLQHVTLIFHAGPRDHGAARTMRRDNLVRFNAIAELAADMDRLQRLCLFSTAFVSGDRSGTILEEELNQGQRLRTPYERAMLALEAFARELMPRLPITVLRPSAMIGHSRTGESSGLTEGPNYLLSLMIRLPAEVPFLLPGPGVVPFNIVPIDYVVHAAWALSLAPESVSRTFHLTDPNPVSAGKAFELLCDVVNRSAAFTTRLPSRVLRSALRLTRVGRLAPSKVALFSDLTTHVIYNCAGTLELLAQTDVVCPPFESYADTLVNWIAEYERRERPAVE